MPIKLGRKILEDFKSGISARSGQNQVNSTSRHSTPTHTLVHTDTLTWTHQHTPTRTDTHPHALTHTHTHWHTHTRTDTHLDRQVYSACYKIIDKKCMPARTWLKWAREGVCMRERESERERERDVITLQAWTERERESCRPYQKNLPNLPRKHTCNVSTSTLGAKMTQMQHLWSEIFSFGAKIAKSCFVFVSNESKTSVQPRLEQILRPLF